MTVARCTVCGSEGLTDIHFNPSEPQDGAVGRCSVCRKYQPVRFDREVTT